MIKKIILIFLLSICLLPKINAQQKDSVIINEVETFWDQGVPVCPDDPYISKMIEKIGFKFIMDSIPTTPEQKKIFCEIGLAFYTRKQYEAADWYLAKSITPVEVVSDGYKIKSIPVNFESSINSRVSVINEMPHIINNPITIIKTVVKEPEVSAVELEGMKKDMEFLNSIPKSLDKMSKADLSKLAKQIDLQIKKLIIEKDSLIRVKATKEAINAKEGTINTLKSEKEVINLSIENDNLSGQNKTLNLIKTKYAQFLIWSIVVVVILVLVLLYMSQRKTIKSKDLKILNQLKDIIKKNTYLEHAAKLIRHDMHSGINTYMPRGINSLEKRISNEEAKNLKIDTSIKMIKEGLTHTQKVYKSVYEFTNLVKPNIVLDRNEVDIKELLTTYLLTTSYGSQVVIENLGTQNVNGTLFCNAIDNLIRNGLKYNDSDNKVVKIYMEKDYLVVQDNGRGMSSEEFERNINKTDTESGIGLSISVSILNEHGYKVTCEKTNVGTKIKIKLKK